MLDFMLMIINILCGLWNFKTYKVYDSIIALIICVLNFSVAISLALKLLTLI